MITFDEGYLGEETSLYTRSKLEKEDKTKVFSEADKEKYLETLRAKYPKQKSLEEQYAEAKLVPEKDREHFIKNILLNFFTNSEIAGDNILLNYDKNKIVKYGNKYYYESYRINRIDEKGKIYLDLKDKLPKDEEFLSLVSSINKAILSPEKLTKELMKIRGKVSNIDEVSKKATSEEIRAITYKNIDIKYIENKKNKYDIASLEKWGISSKGENQGIVHFQNYSKKYPERLNSLEKRLGIEEGSFSNNEKGFKEFTIQAEKIIKNPALKNVIRKKEFYYIDGKNKIRDGVIVIKYNDKIQTMMPGDLKSYIKMIQNENIKITNTK